MNRQGGMSLIELLIAVSLGSAMITMLGHQFVKMRAHYHREKTQLEQSLELQGVAELIRDRVRRVGFTPCLSLTALSRRDQRTGAVNFPVFKAGNHPKPTLSIGRMSERFNVIQQQLGSNVLIVAQTYSVNPDYPVLIADCLRAEIHEIESVVRVKWGQKITLKQPLTAQYQTPAYLGEWIEEHFLIHSGGKRQPALFYQTHQRDELSSEIVGIHVEESIKKNGRVRVNLQMKDGHTAFVETQVRAG